MSDALPLPGALSGLRVLELADQTGQFCGKLLGDLGADVIKIEPPDGEPCRRIGPFLDDIPHPEPTLPATRRHVRAGWKCAIPDFPICDANSSKMAIYRLTAPPDTTPIFQRYPGSPKGRRVSLSVRGCRSSGPRITAWTFRRGCRIWTFQPGGQFCAANSRSRRRRGDQAV